MDKEWPVPPSSKQHQEVEMGGKEQRQEVSGERCVLKRSNSRQEVKYQRYPRGRRERKRRKASEKATEDDEDVHARTTDDDHSDIPPKPSPAFSTSLSSPSLRALGKGRKIGLASNPTVARIVGLDIPGEQTTGLENAWVKDCI
jgi:hypothetical protein